LSSQLRENYRREEGGSGKKLAIVCRRGRGDQIINHYEKD